MQYQNLKNKLGAIREKKKEIKEANNSNEQDLGCQTDSSIVIDTDIIQGTDVLIESKAGFHSNFKFLEMSIDSIFDYLDRLQEAPETQDDIYTAIRGLCERTLSRLPSIETQNGEEVII